MFYIPKSHPKKGNKDCSYYFTVSSNTLQLFPIEKQLLTHQKKKNQIHLKSQISVPTEVRESSTVAFSRF